MALCLLQIKQNQCKKGKLCRGQAPTEFFAGIFCRAEAPSAQNKKRWLKTKSAQVNRKARRENGKRGPEKRNPPRESLLTCPSVLQWANGSRRCPWAYGWLWTSVVLWLGAGEFFECRVERSQAAERHSGQRPASGATHRLGLATLCHLPHRSL